MSMRGRLTKIRGDLENGTLTKCKRRDGRKREGRGERDYPDVRRERTNGLIAT
jgi:hypothetical protein